jgi:hypothetical protein
MTTHITYEEPSQRHERIQCQISENWERQVRRERFAAPDDLPEPKVIPNGYRVETFDFATEGRENRFFDTLGDAMRFGKDERARVGNNGPWRGNFQIYRGEQYIMGV